MISLQSSVDGPELGDMSAKLTQLVMVSKGFDPKQAKHGIFDKAMSIFHGQKEQLLAQLQTVDQQVKRIVAELDRKVALHQQRIRDVNDLQVENLAYHEERKACVAQFQEWLDAVMTTLAQPVDNADGMAAVRLSSLNHLKQRLETGIADASNAMLLAKQRAIKLQMTGDTSRAILEQFDRVKDNVIPALKSILEDQLIALEQKDAIAFDDMLASTLDGALRANAQQTADNTVASARMLQKSTVSVSTIADCQKILDETAGKVREIEEAGRLQRIEDAAQRKAIEHDMLASVTR